jgi:hypothetical protein
MTGNADQAGYQKFGARRAAPQKSVPAGTRRKSDCHVVVADCVSLAANSQVYQATDVARIFSVRASFR